MRSGFNISIKRNAFISNVMHLFLTDWTEGRATQPAYDSKKKQSQM